MDLKGRTSIEMRIATKDDVTRLNVDGAVGLTGGTGPLPALLGTEAKLALTAALRAGELAIERAQLDGRTGAPLRDRYASRRRIRLQVEGRTLGSRCARTGPEGLAFRGRASARHAGELALEARARGDIGTPDFAPETLEARLSAKGPPAAPSGTLRAARAIAGRAARAGGAAAA